MATSKTAMMKIRLAKKLGRDLPEGVAIDKDGNATINPEEAMDGALLPFGGYKGSAMALMVEVLTRTMFDIKDNERGFLFIFINPAVFKEINQFKKEVSELITNIKSSRKAEGVEEIFIPGERSEKIKQENLKKDYLEIDDKIIEDIRSLL